MKHLHKHVLRKKETTRMNPTFWNFTLDKNRLKIFVAWFLKTQGEKKTLELLEQLKTLGFGQATRAGISLGVEDLKIPPEKIALLAQAEKNVAESLLLYRQGEISGFEKMQRFIETWHETSELLKDEVVRYFEKTDVLNPVYMMAFSGARGNLSQVRQLVGMRGLMADPQGKIIDFPIQSNFREGLTLTEYLISTYGARKGIVDTALRTATAGYLTRRLVDVAQHVFVSKFDCGTQRGIFLFDMKEGTKTIYSFQNRLIGRVLNQNVYDSTALPVARRNQEITPELATALSKIMKKALVRSPLTCTTRKLVCQLCYGWSLATSRLVSIGEAVGVIAGQSIGEPGTQLTMRTFHTGGVFSAGITEQIKAPFSGVVEYSSPIAGTMIRTPHGKLAFLTKTNGVLFLKKNKTPSTGTLSTEQDLGDVQNSENLATYKLPPFTILFSRHAEFIEKESLLAQISAITIGQKQTQTIEQTIYSSLEGEVHYTSIDLLEDIDEKYGERVSKSEKWARVWVLSANLYKNPLYATFFPKVGDLVSKNSILNQVQWFQRLPQTSFLGPSALRLQENRQYETDWQASSRVQLKKESKTNSILGSSKNFRDSQSKTTSQVVRVKQNSEVLNSAFASTELKSNDGVRVYSIYKMKRALLVDINNPEKTSERDPDSKVKARSSSFFQVKQLTHSMRCFSYPYLFNTRSRFAKFLLERSLSFPSVPPGAIRFWLTEKGLDEKKFETPFSVSKSLLRQHTLLRQKFKLHARFEKEERSKSNFFHPLILARSVPFQLKTSPLKSYLKRKQLFFEALSTESMRSNFFSSSDKKTVFFKTFPKYKSEKRNGFLGLNSRFLPFEPRVRDSKKTKKTMMKFEDFTIKTPLLCVPTRNVTYSKFGYFSTTAVGQNETHKFFSALPLQNRSFQTSSLNPSLETMHSNANVSDGRGRKTSFNGFGLNNVDSWYAPETHLFYWFPQSTGTIPKGLVWIQNPFFHQRTFQNLYLETKQKNLKTLKHQTKVWMRVLNLTHSYNLGSFKVRSSFETPDFSGSNEFFFKTKNAFSRTTRFRSAAFFGDRSKENVFKDFTKSNVFQAKLVFKRDSKISALMSSRFSNSKALPPTHRIFGRPILSATLVFRKTSFRRWAGFKQNETKPNLDFKFKLFVLKNKTTIPRKRQGSLCFNATQKTSVCFCDVYSLPRETYRFHSYLPNALKNQNFFVGSTHTKKFPIYLTNAQGVKKPFDFKKDSLVTIRKQKSFSQPTHTVSIPRDVLFNLNRSRRHASKMSRTFFDAVESCASSENVSLLFQRKFLNYLQTKKFKTTVFNQTKTFRTPKSDDSIVSIPSLNSNRTLSLTFLPFLKGRKRVLQNALRTNPRRVEHFSNTSFGEFKVTLRTGWFYLTKDSSVFLKKPDDLIDPGKKLIDDVYFNDQKVLLENDLCIRELSVLSKSLENFENRAFQDFRPKVVIRNLSSRFANPDRIFETNLNHVFCSRAKKKSLFAVFIRPLTHKMLPSAPMLKRELHRKLHRKVRLKVKSSFQFYSDYFSKELNLQTKSSKNLSNLAAPDFNVTPIDSDFLECQLRKNSDPIDFDVRKSKKTVNLCGDSSQSNRLSPFFFMRLKKTFFESSFSSTRFKNAKPKLESSLGRNCYLVNSNLSLKYCRVSLDTSESSLVDSTFSTIALNFQSPIVPIDHAWNHASRIFLRNGDLRFLLLRNLQQLNAQENENQSQRARSKRFVSLSSFLFDVDYQKFRSVPVFEYAVNYKHALFANQRLFASAFYKQQFQQISRFDFLAAPTFADENVTPPGFVRIATRYGNFSEAFFFQPISKNQFRVNSQTFELKKPFGTTSFYSPAEAEIVKDYEDSFVLKNAEKTSNVNLDRSFQLDRKSYKLLLTKSDLFGLKFKDSIPFENRRKQASSRLNPSLKSRNVSNTKIAIDPNTKRAFFETPAIKEKFRLICSEHERFKNRERKFREDLEDDRYALRDFTTIYDNKLYKLKNLGFGFVKPFQKLRLGEFLNTGDCLYSEFTTRRSGQIVHLNAAKLTLRKAEIFSISPRAILHTYNGHYLMKNSPVMTLPFETLKTGDIVQGIPKVEQYLEARTTIRGRLFLNSLPFLLYAIYRRYLTKLDMEKAVRQSFLKIQQILVDGVQRVYRSQGVSIADKHLEIIVRQMTSKVKITYGGQTGFFAGEFVDLEFIERVNRFLRVKVRYEPIVLGITRASLEVDSFLSAASFQQTTKVLTRAALENKKDFLKGLKENLLVGNLLPAGTGYVVPYADE